MGPKTQCLLARYAYLEDAYIEVLLSWYWLEASSHNHGYGYIPLQWLLRLSNLLLYINLDTLCILLGPLCLSYQYNQYALLVPLTSTVGACCLLYALNSASAADGRRSRPKIPVRACSDYYIGYGPKFYAYS